MDWITTTQVLEDLKSPDGGSAWQHLYDCFFEVIVNFAQKLGLSTADAEDAAQETMLNFMNAYREGKYQREKGHLSHWLFGVARRTIYSFRQKRPPEMLVTGTETRTSFWNKVPDLRSPTDFICAMEKCMERARRELHTQTFQAFELYALKKIAPEEVARRLRMTPNAVYIAKNRVLSRLQELEKEFEGVTNN